MTLMMLRRHVSLGRVLFGVLVLAAVAITVWAAAEPRFPLDVALTRAWQEHIPSPLEPVMTAVNEWAQTARWIAAIALLVYGFVTRRRFVWFIIVPLIASALTLLLKEIVDRPRPTADLVQVLEHPGSASFPSGHAMNTTMFVGLLYVLIADMAPPGAVRTAVRAACSAFIIAGWPGPGVRGRALAQRCAWRLLYRGGTDGEVLPNTSPRGVS